MTNNVLYIIIYCVKRIIFHDYVATELTWVVNCCLDFNLEKPWRDRKKKSKEPTK